MKRFEICFACWNADKTSKVGRCTIVEGIDLQDAIANFKKESHYQYTDIIESLCSEYKVNFEY